MNKGRDDSERGNLIRMRTSTADADHGNPQGGNAVARPGSRHNLSPGQAPQKLTNNARQRNRQDALLCTEGNHSGPCRCQVMCCRHQRGKRLCSSMSSLMLYAFDAEWSATLFEATQSSRSCHDLTNDSAPSRWRSAASCPSAMPAATNFAITSSAPPPSTGRTSPTLP